MNAKYRQITPVLLCFAAFFFCHPVVYAQGTAFTYQGQLESNGAPVNGLYDFEFSLSNAPTGGAQIGSTISRPAIGVTNGLFATTLDFGQVFSGNPTWLWIGVRTNGAASYDGLSPLQELTPAPYSVFAATASNLSGTIPTADLPGFQAPNYNSIGGGSGNSAASTYGAIGGGQGNNVGQDATVAGGYGNNANGYASSIAGGEGNATGGGSYGVVGGGYDNNDANGQTYETIAGGGENVAGASGATVSGGIDNYATGSGSSVGGGYANQSTDDYTVIGGGFGNQATNKYGIAAGGYENFVYGEAAFAAGYGNLASGSYATVPGGYNNIAGGEYSFAAGNSAIATNPGAFVWADSLNASFGSTSNNQFSVRATGGVRLVTSGAGLAIDGQPVLAGLNGAALTNINFSQLTGSISPAQLPTPVTLLSDPGTLNFFAGQNAGNSNLAGMDNLAIGAQALSADTSGSYNTAAGIGALLKNTSGMNNAALGDDALSFNTDGSSNVAVGADSLSFNTSGNNNAAVGCESMIFNSTGSNNTALGASALQVCTTDFGVVAIGYQALQNENAVNRTEVSGLGFITVPNGRNTAVGFQSLASDTT